MPSRKVIQKYVAPVLTAAALVYGAGYTHGRFGDGEMISRGACDRIVEEHGHVLRQEWSDSDRAKRESGMLIDETPWRIFKESDGQVTRFAAADDLDSRMKVSIELPAHTAQEGKPGRVMIVLSPDEGSITSYSVEAQGAGKRFLDICKLRMAGSTSSYMR